jgi:hypothetical protein
MIPEKLTIQFNKHFEKFKQLYNFILKTTYKIDKMLQTSAQIKRQDFFLFRLMRIFSFCLFILICCCAMGQSNPSKLDDPSIQSMPKTILGYWKIEGISFLCPEAPEIEKKFNSQTVQMSISSMAASQIFHFLPNDSLETGPITGGQINRKYWLSADTLLIQNLDFVPIELSEDSLQLLYEAMEKDSTLQFEQRYDTVISVEKNIVTQINDNNLTVTKNMKFDLLDLGPLAGFLYNFEEQLVGKTFSVTTRYNRYFPPNASWTKLPLKIEKDTTFNFTENMFPSAKNLAVAGNKQLCFLKKVQDSLYSQEDNRYYDNDIYCIYYSEDAGMNWKKRDLDFLLSKEERTWMRNLSDYILVKNQETFYAHDVTGVFQKADTTFFYNSLPQKWHNVRKLDQAFKSIPKGNFNIKETTISPYQIIGFGEYRNAQKRKIEYRIFSFEVESNEWKTYDFSNELFNITPHHIQILDSASYIFCQYGVLKSTDKGKTWLKHTSNDIGIQINQQTVLGEIGNVFLKHGNLWFQGGYTGVWVSQNGGLYWQELNNIEIKKNGVESIAIMNNYIFALDNEYNIWRSSIDDLMQYLQSRQSRPSK